MRVNQHRHVSNFFIRDEAMGLENHHLLDRVRPVLEGVDLPAEQQLARFLD